MVQKDWFFKKNLNLPDVKLQFLYNNKLPSSFVAFYFLKYIKINLKASVFSCQYPVIKTP